MEFYITEEERMELSEFILANGGIFIPFKVHDTPNIITLKNKEEFLYYYIEKKCDYFFIVSPSFQVEPMVLIKSKFDNRYHFVQSAGGPSMLIEFNSYRSPAINQKSVMIWHYKYFTHYGSDTNETFEESVELKAFYKLIRAFLKPKCKRFIASNGLKYWVSNNLEI